MKFKTHELHINSKYHKGIVVDKISHTPYDSTQIHRHNYYEMLLFARGNGGTHIIDFDNHAIKNQSLYTIGPGQIHLLKNKPGSQGIYIQFTKEFLQLNFSPLHGKWMHLIERYPEIIFDDIKFTELFSLFEAMQATFDSHSELAFYKVVNYVGLLLAEVAEFIRAAPQYQANQPNSIASRFVWLVQQNIRQKRSVQEYADLINISATRLTRQIRQSLDKSPKEMIQEYLFLEIKRLLTVGELSHKEIAFALNFDSQNSYNRFIGKYTACTPSELKQQLIEIHK